MYSESDLISVIVPIYNNAVYLPYCLDSLLAQTDQNWEAILIDDGSTDDSLAICRAYAAKDSRFAAFHQENAGVCAARNLGITKASGRYLCFVDSDDWVEPDYLAVMRRCIGNAQMAVCGVECDDPEPLHTETIPLDVLRAKPSRYAKNVYLNYSVNRLYITDILRDNGIFMPLGMKRGEDAVFLAAYLQHCRIVSVSDRILYHYRSNQSSAMHRFQPSICEDETMVIQRQYDFFHPHGPKSLDAEEETAFRSWLFGKVLGILRYILQYAPDDAVCKRQVRYLLEFPLARHTMLNPPATAGKKAILAALLLQMHAWNGLIRVLKTM